MKQTVYSAKELYELSKNQKNYNGYYQKVFKRIFDIIFGVIALPFLLILIVIIGTIIKFDDHGPVFYKSSRIGKDFKDFKMLKFRTMKTNSPDLRNSDGSTYNSASDIRVTRIGKFLRKNSIDELPQILNVLSGKMSFVGPRAGDIESKDTYENDEKDKLLVRPGITGYTQAYYRNSIGVREKRLYDAWYAHKGTFQLDLKIILKTITAVFKSENIYTNDN